MSEDSGVFNGKVSVRHTIEYYEEMDAKEYYLRKIASLLTDEEFNKLSKYVERITKKRISISLGNKKMRSEKDKFSGKIIF